MLRGIDLAVAEHEAVALIGASGSGKSTLLRCIDLLEEIDDGDVLLDGEVVTDPSVDPVARAPAARHGLPGLQPVPAPDRARQRHARAGARARRAARRGGGARARAARPLRARRARATTTPTGSPAASSSAWRSPARWPPRPRALLLDEVTSALDPELVGEVLDAVRELKAEGMTMVIATHEMAFAREVADEVCFLHEGLIVERGAPERFFTAPGAPGDPALPAPAAGRRPACRGTTAGRRGGRPYPADACCHGRRGPRPAGHWDAPPPRLQEFPCPRPIRIRRTAVPSLRS